jgi:hypothetical protein
MKAKAVDITNHAKIPPKPVNRTPAHKLGEKHQPKGFKGIIPKPSPSAALLDPK